MGGVPPAQHQQPGQRYQAGGEGAATADAAVSRSHRLAECQKYGGTRLGSLAKERLLDFVCPMNYRSSSALFANDLSRQKQQLGGLESILPGIGVSSEICRRKN